MSERHRRLVFSTEFKESPINAAISYLDADKLLLACGQELG
jgi:hypothetical protein